MRFTSIYCAWLLGCWMAFGQSFGLRAQGQDLTFYASELTSGMKPVVSLAGTWSDEDNQQLNVPFTVADKKQTILRRTFDIPGYETLPDSLYLYFEGLAWRAEVYLNNRLIGVTEDPFAEHLMLLEKDLFLEKGNIAEVRLFWDGSDREFYPQHFIGIFRQAFVLAADPEGCFAPPGNRTSRANKAIVMFPWSKSNGFLHDTVAIQSMLDGFFSISPGSVISFPLRPSSHSLHLIAKRNVTIVPFGEDIDSLGFFNSFPLSSASKPLLTPFWRTENLRPTADFGAYLTWAQIKAPQVRPLDKLALIIFIFLPVLCMVLLKLLSPRLFDTLPEYLTRSKIYMELIASNKFMKDEQLLAMTMMRLLFLSLMVTLYLYYLGVTGTWERVNMLSERSLLFQIFAGGSQSPYLLLVEILGFIAALTIAKYFMLNFIGGVYRIHNFSSSVQALDVFGSFPLNILALMPGAVIFFLGPSEGDVILMVWYVLILVYWLRRLYYVYSGLTRLFTLPLSLKILYICTLEISPWIFLL